MLAVVTTIELSVRVMPPYESVTLDWPYRLDELWPRYFSEGIFVKSSDADDEALVFAFSAHIDAVSTGLVDAITSLLLALVIVCLFLSNGLIRSDELNVFVWNLL